MNARQPARKEKQDTTRKTSGKSSLKQARKGFAGFGFVIALWGFLLYANTLKHDFVLDDVSVITKNWVVKQGVKSFPTILTTSYRYGYRHSQDELYRPIPLMVFATLWQASHGNPFVFHLLNVLIYALTGLVLFHVLLKVLDGYHPLIPFLASLFFISHPVHTEVVANIKSLDEMLSFLFVLLCLQQLWKYAAKPKMLTLAYSWIFFFLAFLCKEGTMVWLILIPLTLNMRTRVSRAAIGKITLVLSSAAFLFVALRAHAIGGLTAGKSFAIQENVLTAAPDILVRLATVFRVLLLYPMKMIWPYPLSADYSFNEIGLSSWTDILPWTALVFYGALVVIALRAFRKNKIISFSIFFFLGSLALYSNLLFTIGSLFAERFLYVPVLAFSIVLVWTMFNVLGIPEKERERNALKIFSRTNQKALIAAMIMLLAYSYGTVARNPDWKDTVTLFREDVIKSPNSAMLHYNYASELKANKALNEKNPVLKNAYLDSSIVHYKRALEIHPGYYEVLEQLGLAYYRRGLDSAAFYYVYKAIEMEPGRSTAYSSLGTLYFDLKHDYSKALELYLQAVKMNPNYLDGWRNVGSTYGTLGQFDLALEAFQQALRLDPVNVTVLNFMAQTYLNKGDQESADRYSRKAKEAGRFAR